MRIDEKEFLLEIIDGKKMDFYLEDDMFEIEGRAKKENDEIIIEVLDGVGHVLEICGQYLKLIDRANCLYAMRLDTDKIFQMEINRVYDKLTNPAAEDFMKMSNLGVEQFFKKQTDTLVWFDTDQKKWVIELNKINMYFSGDRYYYDTVNELFEENKEQMAGVWQAVYYSSEAESA